MPDGAVDPEGYPEDEEDANVNLVVEELFEAVGSACREEEEAVRKGQVVPGSD